MRRCDARAEPEPSPIAFKNTRAGMKSAAKTVKLSNTLSNKAGFGVNFAAISTDNPVFAITKNKCTTELLPKKKCAISLTATPTSAGTSFSGNLMVQSDVGTLNIPLTVTGD
ncbi:MAG: choice-of-anchor D domain-containing protein [Candidatus Binataceae bacterium]